MSEFPTTNHDKDIGPLSSPVQPAGLDPVSDPAFVDIVETQKTDFYGRTPTSPPIERRSDFTPMTWGMIVVAGIVLGFAVALMLAGA